MPDAIRNPEVLRKTYNPGCRIRFQCRINSIIFSGLTPASTVGMTNRANFLSCIHQQALVPQSKNASPSKACFSDFDVLPTFVPRPAHRRTGRNSTRRLSEPRDARVSSGASGRCGDGTVNPKGSWTRALSFGSVFFRAKENEQSFKRGTANDWIAGFKEQDQGIFISGGAAIIR